MKTEINSPLETPSTDIIKHVRKEWNPAQDDDVSKLKKDYAVWVERVAVTQDAAAKQLYDNPDSCPIQLRFHLQNFAALLSRGQLMVLKAYDLSSRGEAPGDFFADEIDNIDRLVPSLVDRLHMWHGSIDSQHDIPDSLKQAFKEVESGDVIEFPA